MFDRGSVSSIDFDSWRFLCMVKQRHVGDRETCDTMTSILPINNANLQLRYVYRDPQYID